MAAAQSSASRRLPSPYSDRSCLRLLNHKYWKKARNQAAFRPAFSLKKTVRLVVRTVIIEY